MALDPKVKALAIDVAAQRPRGEFNLQDMEDSLRVKMSELVCKDDGSIDYYKWTQNNKYLFEILGVMIDEITPASVKSTFMPFAEVKTYAHGDKPRFVTKKGKKNVKRFVTKVAAAGVYERVRLDRTYVDVDTYAHGGAVYQTLEGFLTGRESISEVLGYMIEAMQETVYDDLITALEGLVSSSAVPTNNKHSHAGFDETSFNSIINVVRAYGDPVILCTLEFAGSLIPGSGWVSEAAMNEKLEKGYVGKYNGVPVVIIPQSFTDETNTTKEIDPGYCYIIPSGSAEKPIKIAFEGDTLIRQVENADWSVEIQMFKKIGLAVLTVNHMGFYRNSSLSTTISAY